MNEHTIVNGIFAVIAIAVFAVRVFRKVPTAPPAAIAPVPTAAVLERPPAPPRARVAAAPSAAEAFSVLDLTLPDAQGPAQPAPVRRRGRSMLGTGVPGSAEWGAAAIVALEILGPPVSLRSGATLGAPHAF